MALGTQKRITEIETFYDLDDEVLRDAFRAIYDSMSVLQKRIDILATKVKNIEDARGEE